MNLVAVFNSLEAPDTSNRNLFNAITLVDFPFVKLAANNEGFPVILISSVADSIFISQKNIRLKYLELTHNLECKISENNNQPSFTDSLSSRTTDVRRQCRVLSN